MNIKEQIEKLIDDHLWIDNGDNLKRYLADSDFYTAPASTRFHGSYKGGLAEHSLNVYKELVKLCEVYYPNIPHSEIVIAAIGHDLCKTHFYVETTRNVKKDGKWTTEPYYTVDDKLAMGHGEGSVYLLKCLNIPLTGEVAQAINWHMGGFDERVRGGSFAISSAYENNKLAVLLHTADLIATYIVERR